MGNAASAEKKQKTKRHFYVWRPHNTHREMWEREECPITAEEKIVIQKQYESTDLLEDTPREKEIAKCNRFLKEAAQSAKTPAGKMDVQRPTVRRKPKNPVGRSHSTDP